jgi:ComEC/Rec2-related protein
MKRGIPGECRRGAEMRISIRLFWLVAAYLAGTYAGPGPCPAPGAAMAAAGLLLAAAGLRSAGTASLAAGLYLLAGPSNVTGGGGGLQPPDGFRHYAGRVESVGRDGLLLEEGGLRFWIRTPAGTGGILTGDSADVLGFPSGRALYAASIRHVPDGTVTGRLRRTAVELWRERIGCRAAASLVAALLAGERSGMPRWVRDRFRASGTSHMLAVSGFHVGLAAALVYVASRRRSRVASVVLVALTTAVYALFAGARPPVVRATVMCTAAAALGGRAPGPVLWAVAAAFVMFAIPGAESDTGAQMSFAAVLGLLVLTRRLPGGKLVEGLYAGVCATVAVAPILVSEFGGIAVASPLATVATTPLMAACMAAGALSLLPAVWRPFAVAADWAAWLWVWILGLADLPAARPGEGWILPWLAVVCVMWLLARRSGFPLRFGSGAVAQEGDEDAAPVVERRLSVVEADGLDGASQGEVDREGVPG